jgi:hypothetical protein
MVQARIIVETAHYTGRHEPDLHRSNGPAASQVAHRHPEAHLKFVFLTG